MIYYEWDCNLNIRVNIPTEFVLSIVFLLAFAECLDTKKGNKLVFIDRPIDNNIYDAGRVIECEGNR